jgi:hypothetical protein
MPSKDGSVGLLPVDYFPAPFLARLKSGDRSMYSDDYEEQQRASNAYLDSQRDQLNFENDLARRRKALDDALSARNHSRAAWELGIVSEDTDSEGVNVKDPREVERAEPTESLADLIWQQGQEVLALLRASDLPTSSKEDWIKRLSSPNWRTQLNPLRRQIAFLRPLPVFFLGKRDWLSELDIRLLSLEGLISRE